jgi:hypothetical protein
LLVCAKLIFYYNEIKQNLTFFYKGSQCDVVDFNNTNELNSIIVCETRSSQLTRVDYVGNRGINLVRDNVYTSFASLDSSVPSSSAKTIWLDVASYQDNQTVDVTIWLNGFLAISKSSDYLFSIKTNGAAKLYLSSDESSVNKVNRQFFFWLVEVNFALV